MKEQSAFEDTEQIAVVKWCWRHGITCHHSPNGGLRSKIEGAKFKRMGTVAGWPDLEFPKMNLYIEMKKRSGGVVSDKQKEVHSFLRSCGRTVEVACGAKEAIAILTKTLNNSGLLD